MHQQNLEEPEFHPPEDETAASALPKLDERPVRKLLRQSLPMQPEFAMDVAPSASIESLAGSRYDAVFAPILGRLSAQAANVRAFLNDVVPIWDRLEGERKRLHTHVLVEGEKAPWGFVTVSGVVFFAVVSGTALYVDANLLGELLKEGGSVDEEQNSTVFALVPLLMSAALKGLHTMIPDGVYRTRYAIGLGVTAVAAGLTWGWGFTEIHAGSAAMVVESDDGGLPPLGVVVAGQAQSNPTLMMLRAGILGGIATASFLWVLMAGVAKSRAPMLRALHPDYLLNAFLRRVLRRRKDRANDLLGDLEGRIRSISCVRDSYVGDALQAYRERMGGTTHSSDRSVGGASKESADRSQSNQFPFEQRSSNGAINHED